MKEIADELIALGAKIDRNNAEKASLKGEGKVLLQNLQKDFGAKSLQQGKAIFKKLKDEYAQKKEEIEKKYKHLQEINPW